MHFIIKIFLTQDVLECTHFFKVKFDNKKSYKIRAGKRFKNLKVFKFRDRDTMEQITLKIDELVDYINKKIEF